MRSNVAHLFPQVTAELEGVFTSPYSDVKRLITTGAGILIDPIERCLKLEWWIGDRRATEAEVRGDWAEIKERARAMSDDDLQHWTATMQAPLTNIRLKADYVDALTLRRAHLNFDYIVKHLIPGLVDAPADAQMGALLLSWAVGAGFDKTTPPRTEFVEACNAGDWLAAAAGARLREEGNRGVIPRNKHMMLCFSNAATVTARQLDPAALWWPNVCPKEDSLKTVAIKALELGLAKDSLFAPARDDDDSDA